MMKECIFLSDLDDTLFRSLSKHEHSDELIRVTTAKNGQHSHMSQVQMAFFHSIRTTGIVIPVTARSSDAFGRVHLDFGTRRAVLANGAIVLDEHGVADPDWLAHTARLGREAERRLREICALIEAEFGPAARTWVVEEYGVPFYSCVKMNASSGEEVKTGILAAAELLAGRLDLAPFRQHINGNNLSLTPVGISKEAACQHLIDRLGDRGKAPLIGIGDSLTDIPFMALCDFVMTPTTSQIFEKIVPLSSNRRASS